MDDGLVWESLSEEHLEELLVLLDPKPSVENKAYLQWKYSDTPKNLALVARDIESSEVAGFYAIITSSVSHTGQIIQSFQSVDTIVNPKYRRRRIMYDLANMVYKNAKDTGAVLVFGWTMGERPAWNSFVRKLGWSDLGAMTTFAYPIRPFRAARAGSSRTIVRVVAGCFLTLRKAMRHPRKPKRNNLETRLGEWNYEGLARCWSHAMADRTFTILKDEKFYKKRFEKSKPMYSEFIPISIYQDGEIKAFAVCSTGITNSYTEGVIADLQVLEGRDDALQLLIWECVRYFKSENADYVRFWAKKPEWIVSILTKSGFTGIKSNMRFILRPLSESMPKGIMDFNSWDLALCDSDHV